jgi:hypothetical protein
MQRRPIIAVLTGGRERTPTLAELEKLTAILVTRGATHVREGEADGTDKAVAAWLKARTSLTVEPWRAEDYGEWPYCGPRRNEAMLDGDGQDLFGVFGNPPADFLVAFAGGVGTTHCVNAAKARGLQVEHIEPVAEPRIWNAHHGLSPVPSIKVGRPAPLGNPWPLELREGETRASAAADALARYKRWLWSRISPNSRSFDRRVRASLEAITAEHYLVCTCWPLHCHAEVIIAAWRWLQAERGGIAPANS